MSSEEVIPRDFVEVRDQYGRYKWHKVLVGDWGPNRPVIATVYQYQLTDFPNRRVPAHMYVNGPDAYETERIRWDMEVEPGMERLAAELLIIDSDDIFGQREPPGSPLGRAQANVTIYGPQAPKTVRLMESLFKKGGSVWDYIQIIQMGDFYFFTSYKERPDRINVPEREDYGTGGFPVNTRSESIRVSAALGAPTDIMGEQLEDSMTKLWNDQPDPYFDFVTINVVDQWVIPHLNLESETIYVQRDVNTFTALVARSDLVLPKLRSGRTIATTRAFLDQYPQYARDTQDRIDGYQVAVRVVELLQQHRDIEVFSLLTSPEATQAMQHVREMQGIIDLDERTKIRQFTDEELEEMHYYVSKDLYELTLEFEQAKKTMELLTTKTFNATILPESKPRAAPPAKRVKAKIVKALLKMLYSGQ